MTKTLLSLIVALTAATAFGQLPTNTKPITLGHIDEIQSKELGEKRSLNIYLPDGYKPDDAAKYPVIYLLDGGLDEDFIHTVGLVQFNSFPWVKRLPPTIVVGIVNIDRQRDYTYATTIAADKKRYPNTGHSEKFIAFVEKELQPYIERTYKVSSRTLIGESLGGLLASEILLKKPALFDKYIIIAPSLWWDDGSLLRFKFDTLAARINKKTDVYIGVGKEGLAGSDTPHVGEVDANVLADKLRAAKIKDLTVYFDYLPQEDHATISEQAVLNAFRWLAPAVK